MELVLGENSSNKDPCLIAVVQLCSSISFKNHVPPASDKLFISLIPPLNKHGTINLLKLNVSFLPL